jgi:chromosome segregation ATPase
MRNDTFDELDDIPSVAASKRERNNRDAPHLDRTQTSERRSGGKGSGILWAIVVALLIALGVLGWWSYRQIAILEQQLVATQESFARISEEAAGRIQDISGKVVATETNVSSGSEATLGQVRQVENRLTELGKQQQALIGHFESLVQRVDSLNSSRAGSAPASIDNSEQVQSLVAQIKQLSAQSAELRDQQKALASEQAELKSARPEQASPDLSAEVDKLSARLNSLATDMNKLRDRNAGYDVQALQQDMTVLRSQLENRNNTEFDAFRGQMTRNINALQSQLQNLQQQLNSR